MTLPDRLTQARADLDGIVQDARADFERLRREQADRRAAVAESAHAHRALASGLERSLRPRHLVASETATPAPDTVLVSYQEPPAVKLGEPSRSYPPLRWGLLRSLLSALACVLVLAWTLPADAHAGLSPMTETALREVLRKAHVDVYRKQPTRNRLDVALAQVALETGRGRFMYCHNPGNIGANRKDPNCTTKGGARVRKYKSARAGARAYWKLSAVKKSLVWFDAGDARGAALALKRAGYYVAPVDSYAEGMAMLVDEYRRKRKGTK